MRTRLLVLLACAATAFGTALVALPTAEAVDPPMWTICSLPSQVRCIESATANGVSTLPGSAGTGPARDFPWIKDLSETPDLLDFGVYHDTNGNGSSLDYAGIDPSVTYVLVVRTGTFRPREMDAVARNGNFAISGNAVAGWKITLQFQPTAIHQVAAGQCSFDGGCVPDTVDATFDEPGVVIGSVDDLAASGLSSREIYARQGMFTTTSAQDSYPYYDIDTGTLEIRLANPHRTAGGVPVTDGNYDAFIPNAYLTYVMGIPDPSALSASAFLVSRASSSAPTTYTVTPEGTGVRIHISNISFSRPTYNIRIKPTAPGQPRLSKVTKTRHSATVRFSAPVANGRARIDKYQARCHAPGRAWHFKTGTRSPLTVGSLPKGRAYCQVRAHNAKGWGRFSPVAHS